MKVICLMIIFQGKSQYYTTTKDKMAGYWAEFSKYPEINRQIGTVSFKAYYLQSSCQINRCLTKIWRI